MMVYFSLADSGDQYRYTTYMDIVHRYDFIPCL